MKLFRTTVVLFLVIGLVYSILLYANAYTIADWANYFNEGNIELYKFYLTGDKRIIDGNTVYYHFANNTVIDEYQTAVSDGIASWRGLINGVEESSVLSAHISVSYKNTVKPDGTLGETHIIPPTGNNYSIGRYVYPKNAVIKFYRSEKFRPSESEQKKAIAAHEFGHLWGIGDAYNTYYANFLQGKTLYYHYDGQVTEPKMSDRNAIRIGTNNLWMETSAAWIRFFEPNEDNAFSRGDVNQNNFVQSNDAQLVLQFVARQITLNNRALILADVDGNGTIQSADARLILRYAAHLISQFPADSIY